MANPLQKGIDTIDYLMDEPTEENIKKAIKELADLTKDSAIFQFIPPLKANLIQYQDAKLAGSNVEGRLSEILIRFLKIYEEFKKTVIPAETRSQDDNYNLLCKLNFRHQSEYFHSLMKGDKKFISFVIRGPQVNYGQRWLANKLIQGSRIEQPIHEPLGLDFLQLNLKLDSFIEHFSTSLGITYQQAIDINDKRIKLKNELVKRITTRSQFIILINSFTFIHSEEYQAFRSMIKYFSEEINNAEIPYKCVFLFVEEQTSARYAHIDDCIFSEEVKQVLQARMIREFRFVDLGLTMPIKPKDITDWLNNCTDEQLYRFRILQEKEDEMQKFIGDGNPQNVIPLICKMIGINYIENEKIWLKY